MYIERLIFWLDEGVEIDTILLVWWSSHVYHNEVMFVFQLLEHLHECIELHITRATLLINLTEVLSV